MIDLVSEDPDAHLHVRGKAGQRSRTLRERRELRTVDCLAGFEVCEDGLGRDVEAIEGQEDVGAGRRLPRARNDVREATERVLVCRLPEDVPALRRQRRKVVTDEPRIAASGATREAYLCPARGSVGHERMQYDAPVVVEAVVLVRAIGAITVVDAGAIPEDTSGDVAPDHRADVALRGRAQVPYCERALHERRRVVADAVLERERQESTDRPER